MMLVAWGVLMPTASAAPRMKFLFPDGTWFLMHQIGVVVGAVVFITAGAMLLAEHDEREIAHSESNAFKAHRAVGVAVGFLWLAQFLLGAFRPNKDVTDGARFGFIPSSWRRWWFIAHATLGPITIVLACVVLVLGVALIRDKYVDKTDSGVKFLADGGVYGVIAATFVACAFGIWRDGFAKAKSVLTNDAARHPAL
jgi:cytochrome b561